jgi:hypothetical protein
MEPASPDVSDPGLEKIVSHQDLLSTTIYAALGALGARGRGYHGDPGQ